MQDDQRYRAPALDKGLDILELLAAQPSGMTRGEIVKALGRSPSEIYRMVERLVARDYVARSAEGDRYALSFKLFQLGAAFPPLRRLVAMAQPHLDWFARETRQSVHLVVPDRGQSYVVAQASSDESWEFRLRIGAELDLMSTGSGLTLLAFMQPGQIDDILALRPNLKRKITPELQKDLDAIRADGFRCGDSQQLRGLIDISVPVQAAQDTIVGVLTCPYLPRIDQTDRTKYKDEDQTRALLQDTAARISFD